MNNIDNTTALPESGKKKFQDKIKDIESRLSEYKSSFPQNYGDAFRAKVMLFCIALAAYCLLSPVAFFNASTAMLSFLVGLPLLIIAIKYYEKPSTDYYTYRQVQLNCNSLKQLEDYPDVKNYLDGLQTELSAAQKSKKKYLRATNILFWCFVAALTALLVRSFVNDNTFLRDDFENIHSGDNCGDFTEIAPYFHLENKKPFVSIQPLDSKITPNNADLFIVNLNTGSGNQAHDCLAGFRFAVPEIKGASSDKNYTLRITDKDGNPSELSFAFRTTDKYIEQRIARTEKPALNISYYLFTHADELRYTVEENKM